MKEAETTIQDLQEQCNYETRLQKSFRNQIDDYRIRLNKETEITNKLQIKVRNTLTGLYSAFLTMVVLITTIVISNHFMAIKSIPGELKKYGIGIAKAMTWLWSKITVLYEWLHQSKG